MFTCGVHMWHSHVVLTHDDHMWNPLVESTCGLLYIMLSCHIHMWSSHVDSTCGFCISCDFMSGVHMWSSHVEFRCGVYTWFKTCTVCDLPHMIYRMWSPHVEFHSNHTRTSTPHAVNHMWFSVCGVRVWSSWVSACGVHMWTPHMI